jgi:hypothetical protein
LQMVLTKWTNLKTIQGTQKQQLSQGLHIDACNRMNNDWDNIWTETTPFTHTQKQPPPPPNGCFPATEIKTNICNKHTSILQWSSRTMNWMCMLCTQCKVFTCTRLIWKQWKWLSSHHLLSHECKHSLLLLVSMYVLDNTVNADKIYTL